MSQTKKALVAFNPRDPQKASSEFLVPVFADAGVKLWSTRSHGAHQYGMVVLTNRSLSANDLFSKIVDAGLTIENVDETLSMLSRFVTQIAVARIGSIVELAQGEQGLEVIVVAKSPSGFGKSAT